MAEILFNVGNKVNYEDGDVLFAFNDKRILKINAQSIAKKFTKSDGLVESGEIIDKYLRNTSLYLFERVAHGRVKKTNLETGEVNYAGDKGSEPMDVPLTVKYRKESKNFPIFGISGKEYWFGGNRMPSMEEVDEIWAMIEKKGKGLKDENRTKKYGRLDLYNRVAVPSVDFPDEDIKELEAPITEQKVVLVGVESRIDTVVKKHRKYKINLDGQFPEFIADIRDIKQKTDLRGQVPNIVKEKLINKDGNNN